MNLVITTLFIDKYNGQTKESVSYVYEDIDSSDLGVLQIIGQVKPLIEHSNELTQEEIVDWNLHEEDEKLWDDWEAPSVMTKEGDNWIATKTGIGDLRLVEWYTMLPDGGRGNFDHKYVNIHAIKDHFDEDEQCMCGKRVKDCPESYDHLTKGY
jgi:hypothetical protein